MWRVEEGGWGVWHDTSFTLVETIEELCLDFFKLYTSIMVPTINPH